MDLSEKKERVVNSYRNTFDREMAYQSAEVSAEEAELLDNDEKFQLRLNGHLINEKERIIKKLRDFMDCEDLKISYQATTDLGKIVYPELFKRVNTPVNLRLTKELTEEEEERVAKEYGLLLGRKHVVKKSADSESQ